MRFIAYVLLQIEKATHRFPNLWSTIPSSIDSWNATCVLRRASLMMALTVTGGLEWCSSELTDSKRSAVKKGCVSAPLGET
jgi:hypothetical protein